MTTQTEVDLFIFLKVGKVQYITLQGKEGLAVARGQINADKVRAKYRISPGRVGSVPGETIEAHMELAKADGIQGIWCLADDGWHWLGFYEGEAE